MSPLGFFLSCQSSPGLFSSLGTQHSLSLLEFMSVPGSMAGIGDTVASIANFSALEECAG
jgi:hypothetical protein